ncbi:MAG: hypothetical protein ACFFD4_24550, partial [Candidatus Odinarchaeota archaeon]
TGELVDIFEKLGKKIADQLKTDYHISSDEISSNEQLKQRLDLLVEIYNAYGKFPELIEQEDCYRLRNYNCLIYSVCKRTVLTCKVDETIIKEIIGVLPVKERDIKKADGYCQYKIDKMK